ncbi:rRNA maturation RNase YbeY [Hydrogenimonas thermophila]|uniref:Endoribonuclease YbeY n=1 Tax=Hydrogenimonas thermophila TaxID=223786 RepID=A0A1I5NLT8_9BACT|nr:rRNA maturation RNase YbeY [Hydrogenimonas thermophila]WOE69273.1 rRNA maturation RNase YbeY [Hydrogenimonas thermophila]WOE71783.1 rRNA maturation RNase YbeY [Hydrogenimonas thermophila]SFP22763.1 probable rRNA maturation factor [Hydrogenimonas thermophila]
MIEIINETDYQPNVNLLKTIAQYLTNRHIEVTLTNNATMREINREQRGIDAPTDVLSFPLEPVPYAPLGELVISVEYAKNQASLYQNSLDDEIALLFIHGLLHLLGYDHETDDGEMRQKEEDLIKHFGLPKSLIVRTEGES